MEILQKYSKILKEDKLHSYNIYLNHSFLFGVKISHDVIINNVKINNVKKLILQKLKPCKSLYLIFGKKLSN